MTKNKAQKSGETNLPLLPENARGVFFVDSRQQIFSINLLFAKRIREERECNGMTQSELAEKAGINRSYLTEIEKGRRNVSLNIAYKIAKGLQIPLYKLLES